MAEEKNHYIKVDNTLIPVSEDIYLAYYRMQRRWSAQNERDTYNGVISYDAMDTSETLGIDNITDADVPTLEDIVVGKLLCEKLHHCLIQLPRSEQNMLHALYFDGLSERQVAKQLGVHYMTVHNRKVKLLQKLKKMMEK